MLCFAGYSCGLDYVKYIRYEELPEIMPANLEKKYQDFINDYINIIRKNILKNKYEARFSIDLDQLQKVEEYGKMVRQVAKHFNLPIDFKALDQNFRSYCINHKKDVFLMFIYDKGRLTFRIRVKNIDIEKYEKILSKAKSLNLSITDLKAYADLGAIELINKNEKSLDELIKTIEESNILKKYNELSNIYV